MAINLGVALGSIAEGGFNTYTKLKDQQDKAADRAQRQQLVDLQLKEDKRKQTEFDQNQAQQQAINNATTSTLGQVGKSSLAPSIQENTGVGPVQAQGLAVNSGDTEFDKAVAQSDINTLNQNAQRQGQAIPTQTPVAPKAMSMDEARQKYAQALYSNPNISPEKAAALQATQQQLELTGYQLNEAKLQTDLNKRFKTFTEDHFARLDKFNKIDPNSAESVASVLGPEYELLHPGQQVSSDKKTNTITFVGDDGKPVAMKPGEAFILAKKLNDDHFASGALKFAKNPTEFVDMTTKIENLKETHAKNQSEAEYQKNMGKAALTNADTNAKIGTSTIAYNNARTESAQVALDLAKNNKAAQEAMRPYQEQIEALTDDEIKAGKGDAIAQKMLLAGATKSADIAKYLAESKKQAKGEWKTVPGVEDLQENSVTGQRRQLDPKTNTWKLQGQGTVSENAARLGVSPHVDQNGQIGYKGADHYYSTEQEAVESFQNKPAAEKPSAIPTEKAKPAEAPAQPTSALPKDAVKNVGYYLKDKSKPWSAEGVSEHFATQAEAEAAYRKAHVQWHLQNPFAKD
jgi:hypothetical protein